MRVNFYYFPNPVRGGTDFRLTPRRENGIRVKGSRQQPVQLVIVISVPQKALQPGTLGGTQTTQCRAGLL